MEDCIFCKIIRGELPSYKVGENDKFLAFLSIGPHRPGHTLVIPKVHVDNFFNLTDEILSDILIFSKPITQKIGSIFKPKLERVGVVVAGVEVPHAHLHLIPMDEIDDLDFSKAKRVSPEELAAVLRRILGG